MAVINPKAIIFLIVLIAIGFWVALPMVQAQIHIYKWTDANGVIHFADDLSKIPPEYRGRIEKEYQFKEKRPEIKKEETKEEKKEEKQERRPN